MLDSRATGAATAMAAFGSAPDFATLLRHAAVPLLLLHLDSTALWANEAGARLVEQAGPLQRLGARVLPRAPQAALPFARALADAATVPVLLRLPGPDGMPRQLRLIPASCLGGTPAVLLAADPGPDWRPAPELIAQALGLTRVQGELVSLLCTGIGTEALCARLRLSPHTLRAHLSLLLARTGAANRTALVAMVMQRVLPLLLVGAHRPRPAGRENLPGNHSEETMVNASQTPSP